MVGGCQYGHASISIHALREESGGWNCRAVRAWAPFQSTLSVRRAAYHAPAQTPDAWISIHALREESGSNPV